MQKPRGGKGKQRFSFQGCITVDHSQPDYFHGEEPAKPAYSTTPPPATGKLVLAWHRGAKVYYLAIKRVQVLPTLHYP